MINPLLEVESTTNEILFKNIFNSNRIFKKITLKNSQDKVKVLKKLKELNMNLDSIVVNEEKGEILSSIKALIGSEYALYTSDSLVEKVVLGFENAEFKIVGKVPKAADRLKTLLSCNGKGEQINYIVFYAEYSQLHDVLNKMRLKDNDTLFFVECSDGNIPSIGPMIKKMYRTNLDDIIRELERPKLYVDIMGINEQDSVFEEYLRALVDYYTEFFSNYSHVWEREIKLYGSRIALSERILN